MSLQGMVFVRPGADAKPGQKNARPSARHEMAPRSCLCPVKVARFCMSPVKVARSCMSPVKVARFCMCPVKVSRSCKCPVKVVRFCLRPVCVVGSAATTLATDTSPIVLEGLKLQQVFGDAGVLLMRKAEATLDSVSLPSTLTPTLKVNPSSILSVSGLR
jgi:hypothetical protein